MTTSAAPPLDPLQVLKAFASLRRLTGAYPAGHPTIAQKLGELDDAIRGHLRVSRELRIDIIHGSLHVDGVSFGGDTQAHAAIVSELSALGIDSIYIREGVQPEELLTVAEFLWRKGRVEPGADRRAARSPGRPLVSLGRLVPLDTRWRARQWPDAPTGPLDPAYAESLMKAQQTFDHVASGRRLDLATVLDLVQLLIYKVARSNAALGQILAVKQYENLTYCHSVNVAMLSLLIGQPDRSRRARPGGARRSGAAARHRQDTHSARRREEAGRARQARTETDRGAHDARRGDPGADRRARPAHADRGARAPSRRQRHRLPGPRGRRAATR